MHSHVILYGTGFELGWNPTEFSFLLRPLSVVVEKILAFTFAIRILPESVHSQANSVEYLCGIIAWHITATSPMKQSSRVSTNLSHCFSLSLSADNPGLNLHIMTTAKLSLTIEWYLQGRVMLYCQFYTQALEGLVQTGLLVIKWLHPEFNMPGEFHAKSWSSGK